MEHGLELAKTAMIGREIRVELIMITGTEHCYIIRDDHILSGEPIIKGTRTPVRAIVEMWRMGIPPEEIPRRLPNGQGSKFKA